MKKKKTAVEKDTAGGSVDSVDESSGRAVSHGGVATTAAPAKVLPHHLTHPTLPQAQGW